jgi:class 3 adenylate cyclase/tetratricopeptide (TPR) repeat protein
MQCSNCAIELPEDARFCRECGHAVQSVCPDCRQMAPPGARFCPTCGARIPGSGRWPASVKDLLQAERRQITLMFTDIVGSTEISSRMDPEELREVIWNYQACVVRAVTEFGGFVARYIGDGILIYFGWPRTGEMDPERSVRAGLAVIRAVRDIRTGGERIQVRVGVATGLVVVGDSMNSDAARQTIAFGEAPNRAARLQGLAEPDCMIIDDATRQQIGGLFNCRDLGPAVLKGFPEPVRAWQVLTETAVESRFDALHSGMMTPLVGRDEELAALLRLWRKARGAKGQLAMLSGEPGIGKSRLIAALEDRLTAEQYASLRHYCFPDRQDSALYPVIACLTTTAGFDREDTPEEKLQKLYTVMSWPNMGDTSDDQSVPMDGNSAFAEDVALIADLLSVPLGLGRLSINYSPRRKKEKTFDALVRLFANYCRHRPLLLLFEDIHWADPSSLELLDKIIQLLPGLPILLVLSFRPELRASWLDNPVATLITPQRLAPREAEQLAVQAIADFTLSPRLLSQIVAHSDGVPLFIEELAKTVLERSRLATGTAAVVTVPDTLRASLMARLDRLPTAKQVAQIGSAIGREFAHSLLSNIAQMPNELLVRGLEQLVGSGLVFCRGTPPDAIYVFKHFLVQDAAYSSLLRSRRAEIHASIVSEMERNPGIEGPQPAFLGYHCAQAGFIQKAATYYRLAGERSEARAAFTETRNLLDRGIALAEALPNSSDSRRLRAELLGTLGRILHMGKGPRDPEALVAFEQAIDLSRTLAGAEPLTRALLTRFLNLWRRANYDAAERDAQELLDVGTLRVDPKAQILGNITLGYTHAIRGLFTEACADIATARQLIEQNPNAQADATFGAGVLTNGLVFGALSLACRGHLDQAVAEATMITLGAQRLSPFARASALLLLSRFALVTRDSDSFLEHTTALRLISEEQGFPDFINAAVCGCGWLAAHAGQLEAGINEMQTSITAMQAAEYWAFGPYWRFMLADALVLAGQVSNALQVIEEALALSSRTGEAWLDAELYRQKGNLLLQVAPQDQQMAEASLLQAIKVARRQSAKLFELRATTSIARVWSALDKKADARILLESACASFAGIVESSDLKEARALLSELYGIM